MGDIKDPNSMSTEELRAELDSHPVHSMSNDELRAELDGQTASQPQEPAPTASGVMHKIGQTADYLGGFTREIPFQVAGGIKQAITGEAPNDGKGMITKEDQAAIERGEGPRSEEYLKRLGVNEGVKIGPTNQRALEGLAIDIAADPITHIGSLVKQLPEAMSAVKGLGNLANESAEKIGEWIYKSGFSKIDAKMAEKGQEPLSQALLESGAPTGTTKSVQNKMKQIGETFGQVRDELYQKAADAGASIDLGHPLEKAESYVQQLLGDKRASVRQAGQELADYLQTEYKSAGKVSLEELSQWKTDLYKRLPRNFYAPEGGGKLTDEGAKFNAALASDFKDAIVDAGNAAQKGLGDSINGINEKWGPIINATKPVAQQVKQAAGTPLVSPLKAVITAHSPLLGGIMEGAELAKTTAVRTAAGKGLMTLGDIGAPGLAVDTARQATLGSVMHGNSGVNSLQQAGQPQ